MDGGRFPTNNNSVSDQLKSRASRTLSDPRLIAAISVICMLTAGLLFLHSGWRILMQESNSIAGIFHLVLNIYAM